MEHRREREDPSQQPTLLLMHGAFAGAWMWEPVLDPRASADCASR